MRSFAHCERHCESTTGFDTCDVHALRVCIPFWKDSPSLSPPFTRSSLTRVTARILPSSAILESVFPRKPTAPRPSLARGATLGILGKEIRRYMNFLNPHQRGTPVFVATIVGRQKSICDKLRSLLLCTGDAPQQD